MIQRKPYLYTKDKSKGRASACAVVNWKNPGLVHFITRCLFKESKPFCFLNVVLLISLFQSSRSVEKIWFGPPLPAAWTNGVKTVCLKVPLCQSGFVKQTTSDCIRLSCCPQVTSRRKSTRVRSWKQQISGGWMNSGRLQKLRCLLLFRYSLMKLSDGHRGSNRSTHIQEIEFASKSKQTENRQDSWGGLCCQRFPDRRDCLSDVRVFPWSWKAAEGEGRGGQGAFCFGWIHTVVPDYMFMTHSPMCVCVCVHHYIVLYRVGAVCVCVCLYPVCIPVPSHGCTHAWNRGKMIIITDNDDDGG